MLEYLTVWLSFRRNANFWDWVRDTYSERELVRLSKEATDCSLIRPCSLFDDQTINQFGLGAGMRRKTVQRLMKRYGDEIVGCCLGAGGYDADLEKTGVSCLSELDLGFQVYDLTTLEEFLVRNALKSASRQLLEEQLSPERILGKCGDSML